MRRAREVTRTKMSIVPHLNHPQSMSPSLPLVTTLSSTRPHYPLYHTSLVYHHPPSPHSFPSCIFSFKLPSSLCHLPFLFLLGRSKFLSIPVTSHIPYHRYPSSIANRFQFRALLYATTCSTDTNTRHTLFAISFDSRFSLGISER